MTSHPHDMGQILEEKVRACEEFLSATLLLKTALETEEMTAVDRLMERRQELIGIIDGIDRRMSTAGQGGAPAPDRRTATRSEEIKGILRQILSVNRDCDAIASDRCGALREAMVSINRQEEGLQGYARGTKRKPTFLNIQT